MNYKGKWVLVRVTDSKHNVLAELKGKVDYSATDRGRAGLTTYYFSIVNKNKNRISLDYGPFCNHYIVRLLTKDEINEVLT